MNILSKRIKQLRINNEMTQEEFGKIINVKKGTISYYESGRNEPSIETLSILADYFNVSLDYFAGRDHYMITDGPSNYGSSICEEELKFIKEIRGITKLHNDMLDNPENLVSRMKLKL